MILFMTEKALGNSDPTPPPPSPDGYVIILPCYPLVHVLSFLLSND